MDLDWSYDGEVKVLMITYLLKIIQDYLQLINSVISTQAAKHLYQVRDKADTHILPEEQTRSFHHVVAQLISMSPKEWCDVRPRGVFLTM